MAKDKLIEYDSNATNNTDCGSVNLAENSMLPSDVNNYAREIMSHLKEFADGTSGINALALTDDTDTNQIKVQAPSAVTTTTTFTLPDGDGDAYQVLKTDGSGTLDWVNVAPNPSLIINGAMQVAQRGTSATGKTTGGYFTVDRNKFDLVNLGTHTYSQSTDAPDGFSNSLRVDCTATASLSADSLLYALAQGIEGQNLQLLKKGTSNAESVTVSFYVKSNKTGTYVLEIYDGMNTRHIAKTYTINSANTWEYKTLTFAGDTSGTLTNSNAFGIGLFFWVGAGSNYTTGTLPSSWASVTNANRAAGLNVNMADSTDNDWSITGVKLEVGETATPFVHRSYGEELALCQRYYRGNPVGHGRVGSAVQSAVNVNFDPPMRSQPSLTLLNGTTAVDELYVSTRDISAIAGSYGNHTTYANGIGILLTQSGLTAPNLVCLFAGRIGCDAEL